jgi:hypothetical protein
MSDSVPVAQQVNMVSVLLPRFYLLNATSLAKPNAKEHLNADIINHRISIVMIVETWFTRKHDSSDLNIDGFPLY